MDRIMRLPEVLSTTGLSRATLYRMMEKRLFPESLQIGPRAVGWRESAVHAWLEGF